MIQNQDLKKKASLAISRYQKNLNEKLQNEDQWGEWNVKDRLELEQSCERALSTWFESGLKIVDQEVQEWIEINHKHRDESLASTSEDLKKSAKKKGLAWHNYAEEWMEEVSSIGMGSYNEEGIIEELKDILIEYWSDRVLEQWPEKCDREEWLQWKEKSVQDESWMAMRSMRLGAYWMNRLEGILDKDLILESVRKKVKELAVEFRLNEDVSNEIELDALVTGNEWIETQDKGIKAWGRLSKEEIKWGYEEIQKDNWIINKIAGGDLEQWRSLCKKIESWDEEKPDRREILLWIQSCIRKDALELLKVGIKKLKAIHELQEHEPTELHYIVAQSMGRSVKIFKWAQEEMNRVLQNKEEHVNRTFDRREETLKHTCQDVSNGFKIWRDCWSHKKMDHQDLMWVLQYWEEMFAKIPWKQWIEAFEDDRFRAPWGAIVEISHAVKDLNVNQELPFKWDERVIEGIKTVAIQHAELKFSSRWAFFKGLIMSDEARHRVARRLMKECKKEMMQGEAQFNEWRRLEESQRISGIWGASPEWLDDLDWEVMNEQERDQWGIEMGYWINTCELDWMFQDDTESEDSWRQEWNRSINALVELREEVKEGRPYWGYQELIEKIRNQVDRVLKDRKELEVEELRARLNKIVKWSQGEFDEIGEALLKIKQCTRAKDNDHWNLKRWAGWMESKKKILWDPGVIGNKELSVMGAGLIQRMMEQEWIEIHNEKEWFERWLNWCGQERLREEWVLKVANFLNKKQTDGVLRGKGVASFMKLVELIKEHQELIGTLKSDEDEKVRSLIKRTRL